MTIPKCIGIIIDGNRRWACKRNLSTISGHEQGYKKLKNFLKWSKEVGIEYVIAYTFSSENWNRSKTEVSYLMKLIVKVFRKDLDELKKERIRVRVIGDISRSPKQVQEVIATTQKETEHLDGITFVAAFSYGGRNEIVYAVNRILAERDKLAGAKITYKDFEKYLWTAGIPDPDLIIRTGSEIRLSNFLPLQSVYSELFFLKTLWPDITKNEFLNVLKEYSSRQRRFGR